MVAGGVHARNRKAPGARPRAWQSRGASAILPGAVASVGAAEPQGAEARPFCWREMQCPPTTTVATGASAPSRSGSASRPRPLTTCDRCGGPIRRLLSAAPFILKGGGWYVTDYPSAGRKKGMEAEKKSSGDPAPSAAPATTGTDAAASTGASSKSDEKKSDGASSDAAAAKPESKPQPRRLPADGGARAQPEPPARAALPHEYLHPARAVDQRPERPPGPLGVGAREPANPRPADPQDAPIGRPGQTPARGGSSGGFRSGRPAGPPRRPGRRPAGARPRTAAPGGAAAARRPPGGRPASSGRPRARRCRVRGTSG